MKTNHRRGFVAGTVHRQECRSQAMKLAASSNRRSAERTTLFNLCIGAVDVDALVLPFRNSQAANPWDFD